MTLLSHAFASRCHRGFLLSLAAFALIIGSLLALPDGSRWLDLPGRQALALAPCLALLVGALSPSFRSARASAAFGALLGLALTAAIILAPAAPALSSLWSREALAALAPAWAPLALSLPLGVLWGLMAHHGAADPALRRPKTLRARAFGDEAASRLPELLARLAQSALPSPLWVALPTESGGLRLVEPLSGAVCAIEPLTLDPAEAGFEQAPCEADGSELAGAPSDAPGEDGMGAHGPQPVALASEWMLSLAWEPGFHPARQWRGARAEISLSRAQALILEGLLSDPSVAEASALS